MNDRLRVGIIGIGMVGSPLMRYFEEQGLRRGTLLFLYDIDPAKGYFDDISMADVIFLCVPTPRSENGAVELSAVRSAFEMIRGQKIVVIKSTVVPGTTESFQEEYPQHKVLFNPEFLTEQKAWEDFIKPDRQIVGFTERSLDAAHSVLMLLPRAPFMSPWGRETYKSIKITATEAEIIKYGGNVFFSRKITFANVLARLSERLGVDYDNVRAGMSADYRIGDSHLNVTHGGYRGFGGYCFPKDIDALIASLYSLGLHEEAELLLEDRTYNEEMLARQGLTLAEVSVHDAQWIAKKMNRSVVDPHASVPQVRKYVVTGGAGFIGSHLVDQLIERGDEVHVVDDFSSGKRAHINQRAIVHEVDIRNRESLDAIFAGAHGVFHCAAQPRMQYSIQEPRKTNDINVTGTINVLLAARDTGVKRVVYSASSSAYGIQKEMPLHEDMAPSPIIPYAIQKQVGEQYCKMFSRFYDLETVSLRYFNVYGPRQTSIADGPYATVVGIFFEQKRKGEPLSVVPDGTHRRDFTHVRDTARANLLAMDSSNVGTGEIINVGTGKNYSMIEVAEMVGGTWTFCEPRQGEARETLADNTRARELLGWQPEITLEEGIEELKKIQ